MKGERDTEGRDTMEGDNMKGERGREIHHEGRGRDTMKGERHYEGREKLWRETRRETL